MAAVLLGQPIIAVTCKTNFELSKVPSELRKSRDVQDNIQIGGAESKWHLLKT